MRRMPSIPTACLAILAAMMSFAASGQEAEKVGDVLSYVSGRSFIYHEVSADRPAPQEAIDGNIEVHHTDVLEAKDDGKIEVKLIPSGQIDIESGRIHLLDDPGGAPIARVEGGLVRVAEAPENYTLVTDLITTEPWGTIYEVLAAARESRLFF